MTLIMTELWSPSIYNPTRTNLIFFVIGRKNVRFYSPKTKSTEPSNVILDMEWETSEFTLKSHIK